MPKQRARKKKGVGIDFQKAKSKVGKKLPQPSNVTKTSFQSKGIVLPEQTITSEKKGAVNQRNQTLTEVLSQLNHHNAKVRKDAVFGLREIIDAFPNELETNIGTIFESLAPKVSDIEKPVRDGLKILFKESIFPRVQEVQLSPFAPLLLVHVCSALTNLSSSIRSSALSFLDLLIDFCPSSITSEISDQLFNHFSVLLSRGSVHSQPMGSLPAVLSCFNKLTIVIFGPFADEASSNSEISTEIYHWGHSQGTKKRKVLHGYGWKQNFSTPKNSFPSEFNYNQPTESFFHASGFIGSDQLDTIAEIFIPILLDIIKECTPGISPSVESDSLHCLSLALGGLLFILQKCSKWNDHSVTQTFFQRLGILFPVKLPPTPLPQLLLSELAAVNVRICHIFLVFIRLMKAENEFLNGYWRESSLDFLEEVLRNGTVVAPEALSSSVSTETQLKLAAPHLPQLVSSVATLVPLLRNEPDRQLSLLLALLNAWNRTKQTSPVKLSCLSAIKTLVVGDGLAFGRTGFSKHTLMEKSNHNHSEWSEIFNAIQNWVSTLPKVLWEVKDKNCHLSEAILLILLDICKSEMWIPDSFDISITPFFCIQTRVSNQIKIKFGPFILLPETSQKIALDLLAYQKSPFSEPLLTALTNCCRHPKISGEILSRTVEIVLGAYHRDLIKPGQVLGFLLGLVLEGNTKESLFSKEKRKAAISSVSTALSHLGEGSTVLYLLEPSINKALLEGQNPEVTFSLLVIISKCLRKSQNNSVPSPKRKVPLKLVPILPSILGKQILHFVCQEGFEVFNKVTVELLRPIFSIMMASPDLISPTVLFLLESTNSEVSDQDWRNLIGGFKAIEILFSMKTFKMSLYSLEKTLKSWFFAIKTKIEVHQNSSEKPILSKVYLTTLSGVALNFNWKIEDFHLQGSETEG